MEVFVKNELPNRILSVLALPGMPIQVIIQAHIIFKNILSSVYGKKVVKKLYLLKNNAGLEIFSRLCHPPIETNVSRL